MAKIPDFESYDYATLLDVYKRIDESKYPERKARVAELIEQRKDTSEAQELFESQKLGKYQTFVPRLIAALLDGLVLTVCGYVLLKCRSSDQI